MTDQRRLLRYIRAQGKTIEILGPSVHRDAEMKDVHQLRVAARRARAAFWLLRHSSRVIKKCPKKMSRHLKKLVRDLGKVRELDIALLGVDDFKMDGSLLRDRYRSARKSLRRRTRKSSLALITKLLHFGEKSVLASTDLSFDKSTKILLAKTKAQLKRANAGAKSRHKLRILLKKLRYSLEAMDRPVVPLERIIKVLGDAHDLRRLQTLLYANTEVRAKRRKLNRKAERLTRPAIRFVLKQLEAHPEESLLTPLKNTTSRPK